MNKTKYFSKFYAYEHINISLDEILNLEKDTEWKKAQVVTEGDIKSNASIINSVRDVSIKNLKSHRDFIDKIVNNYLEDYCNENNIDIKSLELDSYGLLKYDPGQFFGEHTDAGMDLPRTVSMVIYLNDDYTGGELHFTNFNTTLRFNTNTLILFPSDSEYCHAAQPVISGRKYVLTGFWK